jgi:tRNA-dihydrouridine synthase
MVTLHARFAKQGFEGEADWKLIKAMREAVSIPLVGNGDVKTPEDAKRMIDETGCDGVMVGRAAISNPWALSRITAALRGDPEPPEPTSETRVETAIEHAKSMIVFEAGLDSWEQACALPSRQREEAELRGIRALRGQLPMYIKGYSGAAEVRGSLSRVSSVAELEGILFDFLERTGPASTGGAEVQSGR